MFKKLTMLMTAVVLAGLMATPTSAHRTNSSSAITTAGVSMRVCASTSCHRIRVIPSHARVRVRGCGRRWCRVSFHGRTGHVSKRYLRRASHTHNRRHNPRRGYRNGIQLQFHFGL